MPERAPFQPRLPLNDLPVGLHVYAPGELFPGRATKTHQPVDLPPGGVWTPRQPAEQSQPVTSPDPDEWPFEFLFTDESSSGAIDSGTQQKERRFSASRIASERALKEAGITEITVDELPVTFTGFRAWRHQKKVRKLERKIESRAKNLQKQQEWGRAAEKGGMYKKDHRPTSASENLLAHGKATLVAHRAVNIASRRQLEYTDGVVRIDPNTGLSTRRKKGSLDHLEPATRRAIERGERKWKRLGEKIEHENHKIVPHANKGKMKKLEDKLADRKEKGQKAALAHELKPVRKAARKAYHGEISKAWRSRTDAALDHRERFYDDLGTATREAIENPGARMTVQTYHTEKLNGPDGQPLEGKEKKRERRARLVEGGGAERAAVVRNSRHKSILESLRERDRSERSIERRKEIMERRAAKYEDHGLTSRKRQRNQKKLTAKRTEVTTRYKKMRDARQRVTDAHRDNG